MALVAVAGELGVVVESADAEVVEAIAQALDALAPHRGLVVVERDQLDEHVTRVGHGERDVGIGRPIAVGRLHAGEVLEQEPRPDLELLDPLAHARVDVLDDVGHLEDAGLGLAESEERHTRAAGYRGCIARRSIS